MTSQPTLWQLTAPLVGLGALATEPNAGLVIDVPDMVRLPASEVAELRRKSRLLLISRLAASEVEVPMAGII